MTLDIAAEVRAALDAAGLTLDAIADRVVAKLSAHTSAELEPLDAILGCTAAAARMKVTRDDGLRAIGVPLGRRLFFRRAEVIALLEQRKAPKRGGRPPGPSRPKLRSITGGGR